MFLISKWKGIPPHQRIQNLFGFYMQRSCTGSLRKTIREAWCYGGWHSQNQYVLIVQGVRVLVLAPSTSHPFTSPEYLLLWFKRKTVVVNFLVSQTLFTHRGENNLWIVKPNDDGRTKCRPRHISSDFDGVKQKVQRHVGPIVDTLSPDIFDR